jgi:nucleotide-binding universal stress UspA family protein
MPIPFLLAAIGLALVAFAIFAPQRVHATPTLSLAPPLAPPVPAWVPPRLETPLIEDIEVPEPRPVTPTWMALIDPLAAGCPPPVRVALVEALATVGTPWAREVLLRAQAEEADALVLAALGEALGGSLSISAET